MGSLVQYNHFVMTPDMASALRTLESRLPEGAKFRVTGLEPGQTPDFVGQTPSHLNLALAGRQVHASLTLPELPVAQRSQKQLEMLWGLMVPLGFTPWDRYPLANSATEGVMSFLGPWQEVFDHLLYQGRGEQAWGSVVRAALVDVGQWKADRAVESLVQAHLHRLGANPGPVDGIVGPQTLAALKEQGVTGKTLEESAETLKLRGRIAAVEPEEQVGTLYLPPGVKSSIVTSGRVTAVQGPTGARLLVQGTGQVVVSLEGKA